MTNISASKTLIQNLYDKGVRSFVICAGARNAAFIESFSKLSNCKNIDIHWGFEERSASFFALGRAKKTGYAAAVFTTSGTALVETHAALVEAYYAGVALVVVSSDRPQNLWGTGAPQTMIQKDIFATQIGHSVNWQDWIAFKKAVFPMHINCPMAEPLVDEEVQKWDLNLTKEIEVKDIITQSSYEAFKNLDLNTLLKEFETLEKPFFILSDLSEYEKPQVDFLLEMNLPFYVESTAEALGFKQRISSEAFDLNFIKENFDSVIRVGGVPTHKIWRQLEDDRRMTVLNFSHSKFPGRSNSYVYSLDILKSFVQRLKLNYSQASFQMLEERSLKIEEILKKHPKSEMSFFSRLKKAITLKSNAEIFLGNSLPIRLWDISGLENNHVVYANRGINGIDGLLSTSYGLSYKSKQTIVAIVGDLSTLYDMVAPWFYLQDKKQYSIKIVVINNFGGQIFSPLFANKKFTTPHELQFEHFAKLWGLTYEKIKTTKVFSAPEQWPDILEIQPDNEQTASVWKEIKQLRS